MKDCPVHQRTIMEVNKITSAEMFKHSGCRRKSITEVVGVEVEKRCTGYLPQFCRQEEGWSESCGFKEAKADQQMGQETFGKFAETGSTRVLGTIPKLPDWKFLH